MKVSELIKLLKTFPAEAEVIQASDQEGNSFAPIGDISLGRFDPYNGEFGLYELTDDLIGLGFSDKDVPDAPAAVCFWP